MKTEKIIEAAFFACVSVGYIAASNPMAQNIGENLGSKQTTVSTQQQVRPVNRHEKVRKPIDVVDIDPDSGLPIFKIKDESNKDDDFSNEYFGEEEIEEEDFYDEILPSLMKSKKFQNQKNAYVKLTPVKKEKKSPKKKNAK